jgi:hypothetical protein
MELEMSILKTLKTVPLPTGSNPVMNRRLRLIRRLEEQAKLAADPDYIRVSTHFTGKGTDRRPVRKEQKVSSWAKDQADGSVIFVVKAGMSAIELEPGSGKYGVLVASRDELPETISTLIEAVREGAFDHALAKTKTIKRKQNNSPAANAASNAVKAASNAAAEMKKRSKVPA